MIDLERLTGNTRHRTSLFGKQVLQVELACQQYSWDGGGSYGPEYTKWRDAKSYEVPK